MYFDFHTHKLSKNAINDLSYQQKEIISGYFYSLGLHPWQVTENWSLEVEKWRSMLLHKQVKLVGETGLDRVRGNFYYQKESLIWHLKVSSDLKKPIVLHMVKSYADLPMILKELKFKEKIIFHDFYGGGEIIRMFKDYDCYFSLGASLVKRPKMKAFIKEIPKDRILLETDDQNAFNIEDIYQHFSLSLGQSHEESIELIKNNTLMVLPEAFSHPS